MSALVELTERLGGRCEELERATLARVYGVSDPAAVGDPGYVTGLKNAVSAALGYGLSGLSSSPESPPPIPPQLLAQARVAARNRVALETVLRRYVAGYAVLGDYLLQSASELGLELNNSELRRIWRSENALLDRLIDAVSEHYRLEAREHVTDRERRRFEQVKRLLAGELLDPSVLPYELGGWHLAATARGPGASAAMRGLASQVSCSLLLIRAEGETVWAWFGSTKRPAGANAALRLVKRHWPKDVPLALGEPGEGVDGWRLSHRQAKAALPIASLSRPRQLCYTEVALLAAALGDEVLARSLAETYLAPLADEKDGGEALREALQAYLASGRNLTSAATALGVSRKTIQKRVQQAEERLEHSLKAHTTELETALRLHELGAGLEFETA